MNRTLHGAWPALITPATDAGEVDLTVLRELVEHLLAKKVDGLYLCGSTGEGLLLTADARRSVVETVMDQVGDQVPVIVHVGSLSTREAMGLALHAQEAGTAGVSSVLPTNPGGVAATFRHFEAIAAAAPDLPFFPYLFGGQIDATTLMTELLCRIPNVCGAKYTGPNMYEIRQIIELGDGQPQDKEWTIFSGMDEQCLFAMMMDAPGNIGSTLNVMPGIYRQMRACYAAGDAAGALALQKRANQVTAVLFAHGFAGALREAMKLLGFDCGPPRLPNEPLAPDKAETLRADLDAAGFAAIAAM